MMLLNEQTKANLGDKKLVGVRQGDKFILGRRNLIPNGQGRYTSGTVEVRRNRANRPAGTSMRVNPGELGFNPRWAGNGGSQQISLLTDIQGPAGTGITTAIRKTWTAIGVHLMDVSFSNTQGGVNSYPVAPGEVYTVSSYWRVSRSQSRIYMSRMAIMSVDASGSILGTIYGGNYAGPIVANEWNRVSATATIPENAAYVEIRQEVAFTDSTALQVGDMLDATGLLVEKSSVLGTYFDGSYSPDPDLTPSWTGTENASQSVLSGVVSTTVMGMLDKSINVQSQAWPIGGTSIRVIPRIANNDSFAEPGGGGGSLQLGLVTGKPVAIKAVGHLFNIQQGTTNNAARRVALGLRVGGAYSFVLGSQMPNEIGDFSSELTTTIPANANNAWVRLYNGASVGNGDVYWTDVRVCQADTEEEALRMVRAPYRDGDFPGWTWDGTPGRSASRGLS